MIMNKLSTKLEMLSEVENTCLDDYRKSVSSRTYRSKTDKLYVETSSLETVSLTNNKVISLFSGAGGLDIGLEAAGFETVVCVEIDADCRETLRSNRPNWKLFEDDSRRVAGDIRYIDTDELLDHAEISKGEAALVVGGAPCQPFSNIGKKQGKDDPQNGDLFLEFVRVVRGLEPAAFIFENVAGFAQKQHAEVVRYMAEKLEDSGYTTDWQILNAADYGVAQRRSRFFLIGMKKGCQPAFPFPTHTKDQKEWDSFVASLDTKPKQIVREWITLGQLLDNLPEMNGRQDLLVMGNSEAVKRRMSLIQPGQNFHALPFDMRPNCWKTGKHQGRDTFGRLSLNEPSVTIRTSAYNPSKGKYIHPIFDRGLNTMEMAAIQGFPYEWEFKCANNRKLNLLSVSRQIGNAVPPPLATQLGLAIKAMLLNFYEKEKE